MARIGLLGGSFNPAHRGHRHISLQAMRALGLDEVWWLVSPGNPLKEGAKDMAPFNARLASAKRMARRAPIRATDFEQRQGTRHGKPDHSCTDDEDFHYSMIPKSGDRFSEKIMLHQIRRVVCRFEEGSSRCSVPIPKFV